MFNLDSLVTAIYGKGTTSEGECCQNPFLSEIKHPLYRCRSCKKKIRLVKVTSIRAIVVPDEEEPRYCVKCGSRVDNLSPGHVYSCTGPGNCVSPAPFKD